MLAFLTPQCYISQTGAENHQEVCPVNSTASDEEKEEAKCDRDEGDVATRFNNAAQAYLEWLPLRRYNGTMGVATIGSITQVVSWGDMATIVAFDTRISHRSQEPTLAGATWGSFFGLAGTETDINQYLNTSSDAYDAMIEAADSVRVLQEDPSFTMIGDDIQTLETAFSQSKAAGQPWQIWAAATALGRAVKGNYNDMAKFESDPVKSATIQAFTDVVFADPGSAFLRALSAHAFTDTPWNRDDFSGFAHEQRQILATMKENSNNPIVVSMCLLTCSRCPFVCPP
jgi:phosphodiesterase/alkaline phosphatase D-like protein